MAELGRMYHRPADYRWSFAEESTAAEVARRREVKEELQTIQRWKSTIPPAKRRFFPQSVSGLLSSWDETLDKARCGVDMRDGKEQQKSIAETNLDRALAAERAMP